MTFALRQKVLRPHQSLSEMEYPGDFLQPNFHLGYLVNQEVQGIASAYGEDLKGNPSEEIFRLRGMAVAPEWKGQGIGGMLLNEVMQVCKTRGGRELWCNARVIACGFYKKFGFKKQGAAFELPGIGTHYVMSVDL